MTTQPTFTAKELSEYIAALGWVQVEKALGDGIYLFKHPKIPSRQLMFGVDDSFDDYYEALEDTARKLAQIYELDFPEATRRIEESNSEVLVARVPDETRHISTVAFTYALQVMEAHKELLLSGAAANERRQTHYVKTNVGDGKKLLESARFRHTEEGSFIFKTSCRLYEFEGDKRSMFSPAEEPITAPFVRRAMLNIGEGLQQVVRSIQTRREDQLVAQIKEDGNSPISSNFCEALGELRDREHPHSIDVFISWSPLLPTPADAPREPIRLVPDYFPVIEDIGKALRPAKKPGQDVYVARVDKLEGTFNNMGQREGRVLLTLLTAREGTIDKPTQVRVVLDAPKYDEALEIHRTTKAVARVEGTIKPSQRQPFAFDLDSFKFISI